MGRSTAGPMITAYVSWILNDAMHNDVNKIYFLARDGYSLYKTAEILCQKNELDIECRYLYSSRISLRVPSFHLIGDEGYDLLCTGGSYVTPDTVLDRLALNSEEKALVLDDIGISSQKDELLDSVSLSKLKSNLRESQVFGRIADRISKNAYNITISYFRQEGLFDQEKIAIADSGWTGSMQRSMRQLLRAEGYTGTICGYYFGMFVEPADKADGEYKTWYFNGKGKISDKIFFCNNLLECMLSAPHGMTLGFRMNGPAVVPVLKECSSQYIEYAQAHSEGIMEYAEHNSGLSGNITFRMRKFIHHVMTKPSEQMIRVYGRIGFCDDLNEKRMIPLADPSQIEGLKRFLLIPRIVNKVFKKRKKSCDVYWPFGTINYLPAFKGWWYRINIYISDWIRFALR